MLLASIMIQDHNRVEIVATHSYQKEEEELSLMFLVQGNQNMPVHPAKGSNFFLNKKK